MKLQKLAGATGEIWQIFVRDSSSTTGGGLTGLTNASGSLTAYYHRDTDTTATAIALVTMTVGTFTSSGFKEIDATNMPGWYQFCPPNAALASGAKSCSFHLKGASNMAPLPIEVQLIAVNIDDAVRMGMTALPNAAAEAAGGLYTRGTGAGQINQDANGRVDVNGKAWAGGAVPAPNVTGVPIVDDKYLLGTIYSTPATAGIQDINPKNIANAAVSATVAQIGVNAVNIGGTAQTGRDIGTSVLLSAGTGTGQLDFTSGVVKANLAQILGTALTETAGLLAGGFKKFFNVAPPAATMDHGVLVDTVTTYTGNTPQTGDAYARLGAPAGASASSDIAAIKAVLPAALISGRIDASVGAMAANVLTATAINADAITAAKIADGAIDAATFAAGAINAAAIAADAITDAKVASDVTIASVTGAVGSVTGNVGGNVTGSVGSVTGLTAANLDVAVSTRLASGSYTAPPSAATVAQAVWDVLTSALITVGSVGKMIVTNIDAAISSRSTYAGADTAGTATLLSRLTSTRAGLLDNLDADISASFTALTSHGDGAWATATGFATAASLATLQTGVDDLPTNTELTAALAGADDATLAAIASLNNLSAAQVNAEADTALSDAGVTTVRMAHLDADVSSRASPTNITAGTITTVTNLTNAPANGDLTATMKASVTTAATAATPTAAGVTGLTVANLDVAVSTRLSSGGYTAPDNASITAVKNRTDNLPDDPADQSLVIAATNAIMTRLGAPAGASLSADIADLPTGAEMDTKLAAADDPVLAAIAALTIPTASANAAALLASAFEDAETVQDFLRLSRAALYGVGVNLETSSPKYKSADGNTDRIIVTGADANGNRPTVTLDAT